jgi:hypothetical protein
MDPIPKRYAHITEIRRKKIKPYYHGAIKKILPGL